MSVEKHQDNLGKALSAVVQAVVSSDVLREKDVALALAQLSLKCLSMTTERPLAIQEAMSALGAATAFLVDECALLVKPSYRFTDNGDGTVTDTHTKLVGSRHEAAWQADV